MAQKRTKARSTDRKGAASKKAKAPTAEAKRPR